MWKDPSREFNVLTGHTLTSITGMNQWNDCVQFKTKTGKLFMLSHHQD